jgi:ERCC4-type nuclease
MTILLDVNEKAHFPKLPAQLGAEVQKLEVGDIYVCGKKGHYLFECKREKDFSSSVMDAKNHLFDQCLDMCYMRDEHGIFPYLIFVGDISNLFFGKGKISYRGYMGIRRSVEFGFRIPIIEVRNEADLIYRIRDLNDWIDSEKEHVTPVSLKKRNIPLHEKIENPICMFEGISRKSARLLFDKGQYKTLRELLSDIINKEEKFRLKVLGRKAKKRQGITALPGIKGFGEKRVNSIYDLLDEEYVRE